MNIDKNEIVVFLDTNVLLKAFATYHKGYKLPNFITDIKTTRYTFEKCIFEAYMAFRGVGGKKPSEGRGNWAQTHLTKNDDPYSVNTLSNKYHGSNTDLAFFWTNNIIGMEYTEYLTEEHRDLLQQRQFFEDLCDQFRQMLQENDVTVLSYIDIFDKDVSHSEALEKSASSAPPYMLDRFSKETIIPSEDFEIIYAALRIWTNIFVTDDNHLTKCAMSLGLNFPLSPAAFCRTDDYEQKIQDYQITVMRKDIEHEV